MSNAALGMMHVIYIIGLALISWGCWDIRPWLGKIVLGLLLAFVAVFSIGTEANKRKAAPPVKVRGPEVH